MTAARRETHRRRAGNLWSTADVDALLTALIGVAATLLGSFTTYLFQSRAARRAQDFERQERLRQEQLTACGAYAAAMTELKRSNITRWFRRQREQDDADYQADRLEGDQLGASAEVARFRIQLVLGDPELMALADAAFSAAARIGRSADRDELGEREDHFEAAVTAFIQAAAVRLHGAAPRTAERQWPGRTVSPWTWRRPGTRG